MFVVDICITLSGGIIYFISVVRNIKSAYGNNVIYINFNIS